MLEAGLPVVCGTTGWVPSKRIRDAGESSGAGAVIAPNFSVGMGLFYRIVERAARLCGAAAQHQPFILEEHHRGKRDVPSGTARKLAGILLEADPRLREIREGNPPGPMPEHVLQVASLRAGAEAGSHPPFNGERGRPLAKGRPELRLNAARALEVVHASSDAAGGAADGEVAGD